MIIGSQTYRNCCVAQIFIPQSRKIRSSSYAYFNNTGKKAITLGSLIRSTKRCLRCLIPRAKTYDIRSMQTGRGGERQVSLEINEDVSREMGIYSILLRNEIKIYTERRFAVCLMAAWDLVAFVYKETVSGSYSMKTGRFENRALQFTSSTVLS